MNRQMVWVLILGLSGAAPSTAFGIESGTSTQTSDVTKKKKKKKKKPFKKLKKGIKKAAKKAKKGIKKAARKAKKGIKKAAKKAKKVVKQAVKGTKKVVRKTVETARKVVKKIKNTVSGFAKCETAASIVGKVWSHTDMQTRQAAYAAAASGTYGTSEIAGNAAEVVNQGIQVWNKVAGKGSRWKVGPRRIKFNEWQSGSVNTSRIMLATVPTSGKVKIEFKRTGGMGNMSVVICKGIWKLPLKKIRGFRVGRRTKRTRTKTIKFHTKLHVIAIVMHSKYAPGPNVVRWKMRVSGRPFGR